MQPIVFEIPGQPVPQPRQRFAKRGKFVQAYTEPGHDIHAYRQAISLMAKATGRRMTGAAGLEVEAVFARPPSHWRKHDLRPGVPAWPRGDGDNLLKGVADAITDSGLWRDDDQVVVWKIRKRYAARSEPPRTVIRITEADP